MTIAAFIRNADKKNYELKSIQINKKNIYAPLESLETFSESRIRMIRYEKF